jgi:hypothetical protein
LAFIVHLDFCKTPAKWLLHYTFWRVIIKSRNEQHTKTRKAGIDMKKYTDMELFYERFKPGKEYLSADALNDGYTIHYIDDHDAPEFYDCSPDDYIVMCNDIPYYVTTDINSKIVGLLTADEIEEFLPNSEAFAAWMRTLTV